MDVLLRVLLSLSALAGIHSITTVSQVSVRAGGSITIPCLYESKYKNHVKYLCKGYSWVSCSDEVKTNKPSSSGKFSISDDKQRKIFTVTINHLTKEDTEYYWCVVEIDGGGDERTYFKLSVTTKTPSRDKTNQEITGSTGSQIAIDCTNSNSGEMKWCMLGGSCLTKSGSIHGTAFTISGNVAGVFTVTMSELSKESSGWYLCVKGDFQMPVHIIVTELTSTTSTTPTTLTNSTTISTSTATTIQTATQNASLFTGAEPPTVQPSFSTAIGTSGESLQDKNKSSTLVWILPTILVLLLLVVPTAFLGWRMKKKRHKTKTEVPVITGGAEVERDPDVHYATIFHNPDAASQLKNSIPEETVTYSAIVLNRSV